MPTINGPITFGKDASKVDKDKFKAAITDKFKPVDKVKKPKKEKEEKQKNLPTPLEVVIEQVVLDRDMLIAVKYVGPKLADKIIELYKSEENLKEALQNGQAIKDLPDNAVERLFQLFFK